MSLVKLNILLYKTRLNLIDVFLGLYAGKKKSD